MKILYDYQAFSGQSFGGVSRLYAELLNQNAVQINDVETKVSIRYSNNDYLKTVSDIKYSPFLENLKSSYRNKLQNFLNRKYTISEIKKNDYDILHPTYYNDYFLKYLRKPFVVTAYDMIHELIIAKDKGLADITIKRKSLLFEKAAQIICISECTKNDLLKFYPKVEEKKINVAYLASSLNPTKIFQKKYIRAIENPYLLFIGRRKSYKEFINMVEELKQTLLESHDLKLLCAGGGEFDNQELAYIQQNGLTQKILLIPRFKTDDDLIGYYKNAKMFIFPSSYEGFGLPVLESFACSCPLLYNKNGGSLPEIAGKAGVGFNLKEKGDLENSVNRILNLDAASKKNLVNEGLQRYNDFSWKNCYNQHVLIYKKAMAN